MVKESPSRAHSASLKKSLDKAVKRVAPLWPLESFVAVNPYLGLSHLNFQAAAQRLAKVGGGQLTLPTEFYLKALEQDAMKRQDVKQVLEQVATHQNMPVEQFIEQLNTEEGPTALPEVQSFTDIATAIMGYDWNQWTVDTISSWAAVYFDQGQAQWNTTQGSRSLFQAWRAEAQINRTPDAHGLPGFRKAVDAMPQGPIEAAQWALHLLGLPTVGIDLYLHRLLMRVQGWAAYAGYLDWQQNLYQKTEGKAQIEFLAVLLCTEAALFQSLEDTQLPQHWEKTRGDLLHLAVEESVNKALTERLILQEAFDKAAQRQLIAQFPAQTNTPKPSQPKAQAVFCIDVRSEVYRRHLEATSPDMETLGFAGFFAFPIHYQPIGHQHGRAQCPVLLPAGATIQETLGTPEATQKAAERRSSAQHLARAWKTFKKGAVSCFGYVSPVGLSFLPKLITDSLGLTRPVPKPEEANLTAKERKSKSIDLTHGLTLDEQVALGQNALKAMSLTENFGRLVLIVGHGANTVNNPHASGLDCGACGGNAGESNARVAAAVLNQPAVRERLRENGLEVPETTWFLPCQHDTTTDEVSIFEADQVPASHHEDLAEVRSWLDQASKGARAERAPRLGVTPEGNLDELVIGRSKDWAQVRPEWGLAGCHAFVVAPRHRTQGLNLQGRSFLHSYKWQQDEGFKVLELIMTAPMVVTSWINLQYFASTVDNERYGAGNKTLHNVTSGLGVLEGSAGDLRTGLPMQSIHDGENYQHLPVRLNVVIEAPIEAMTDILERHENVRQLLDNQWIFLWAMDETGRVAHRYQGGLQWETVEA